jgi:hypothetical protein
MADKPGEPFFLNERGVITERDAFSVGGALAFGGALLAAVSVVLLAAFFKLPELASILAVLPVAAPLGALAWWAEPRFLIAHVQVHAEPARVCFTVEDVVREVPLAQIVSAWRGIFAVHMANGGVHKLQGTPAVMLQLRNGTLFRVAMRDDAEAAAFLRALGRDPSEARTAFRGRRAFHSVMFWIAGLPLAAGYTTLVVKLTRSLEWAQRPLLAPTFFVMLAILLRRVMRPHLNLEIGTTGILDRSGLRNRFHPWSQVTSVRQGSGAIELLCRDGTRRALWCNPDDTTVLPAVCARAQLSLENYQRSEASQDVIEALDRAGRTITQWRADLSTLLDQTAGYRNVIVDRTRLTAVLADPAAPIERRVAAALALAHKDPTDATTRVRVALEASASPDERQLFARIADGAIDDATLDAALRER